MTLSSFLAKQASFKDVEAIYNSLPREQQLMLSPRGYFVDSPFTALRYVTPDKNGFAEAYKLNGKSKDKAFVTIGVKPEAQGKGLSKSIMNELINQARAQGINELIYKADNKNTASQRLANSIAGDPYRVTKDSSEWRIKVPKASPERAALINSILNAYKKKYNIDMSYMKFIDTDTPRYNNDKPVKESFNAPFGGSWTKKKKIYLNKDMEIPIKAFNLKEDKDAFTSRIVAHELAHELYENHASDAFKKQINDQILKSKFSTPYLKSVSKDKMDYEAFAEYLAQNILNK